MLGNYKTIPKKEVTRVESSLSRFLIFSIASLSFFAILNTLLGLYALASIQAFIAILLPLLYIWLKHGGSQTFIKHSIGFATLTVFVPLLFFPSADNTGIYWIFLYPLVAFFFLGKRAGIQWSAIYVASILAGLTFTYIEHIPLYYTSSQISLSLVELLLCSMISYFFVSDNEKAETKLQAHVHYLRSVDHIERALHSHTEIEKGMYHALQILLETFHTSRACLMPPSGDHIHNSFTPFECTVDDYPNTLDMEEMLTVCKESIQLLTGSQDYDKPVCYDDQHPFPSHSSDLQILSIQSQMLIALHPIKDQTWLLGLHQCDHPRHWTGDEQRLFQDIARRMEGALQQMLLYQDLKDSAESLAEATEQAEAASHAKSEFLSVMSHELRTPLHGIIGLQELIAEDKKHLTSEQLEHLTLAQQAARSLSDLVNDILNLSKVESGTIQLNRKEFSLKNVLLDAIAPFVIACRNKHLPLYLHLENVPEFIIGDEIRLRQILINIIGNAVKFTSQGSINIHIDRSGDNLSFAIKDTGIGISPDMLEHIFEPFHQEAQLMQQQHAGTGLGTTIAKRFVELMGGKIRADSVLSVGSCFTFDIPFVAGKENNIHWKVDGTKILDQSAPPPQVNKQPEKAMLNHIHILLAEDDPISQRIAAKRLRRMGILVDIAEDGFTAWVKSQTGQHDLLLTDIRMPKMDGIELTRRIRQYEKDHNKPRLPIVGLSAHALAEIEFECTKAGMDDFIAKPVEPNAVLAKITELIPSNTNTLPDYSI